jgi:hypothetical protein
MAAWRRAGISSPRKFALPLLVASLLAGIYLLSTRPSSTSLPDALLGVAIVWLGVAPSIAYLLTRRRPPMPFMALTGLYYIAAFGLPVFQDLAGENVRFTEISTHAALLVVGGLSFFYCGYYLAMQFLVRRIRPFSLPPQDPGKLRIALWLLMALHLTGVFFASLRAIPSVPHFAEAAGFVASGMLFWKYLSGELSRAEKPLLLAGIGLQFTARLASGFMAQVLELGIFLILVYWVQRRKVPWKSIAVMVTGFVLFNSVKVEYRRAAWFGAYSDASAPRKAAMFVQLSYEKLQRQGEYVGAAYDSVVNRASQIGFLTYVIQETPDVVPYWNGETYSFLPYMLIPRIIWPDKPTQTLGFEFSHRYGTRDESDTSSSFNLPWIVELYANFGDAGALVGLGLIGVLFAALEAKFNNAAMAPVELIIGMTILHDLINHESNFSMTCGNVGLYALSFWAYFSVLGARGYGPRVRRAAVPAWRNDAICGVNPRQTA